MVILKQGQRSIIINFQNVLVEMHQDLNFERHKTCMEQFTNVQAERKIHDPRWLPMTLVSERFSHVLSSLFDLKKM